MKSLTLYIDKWYIVGAVNIDNMLQFITLPNKEDRIWLYFYEDLNNDRIYYGKNNKRCCQNKEANCIGDVFSLLMDSQAKFHRFGRENDLKDIFKASEIFDHLRNSYEAYGGTVADNIPTFISFSQDISDGAKSIFLEQLQSNGFEVKEYVALIELLAINYGRCKRLLEGNAGKSILVLNAVNENLHLSLYEVNDSFFIEQAGDVLEGYGTDVRRHAIIEEVVMQVNKSTRFLTTQEELNRESLRMGEFVEDWLLQLDNTRAGMPTRIPRVSFAIAPDNYSSVTLKKAIIDERTKTIIMHIVSYIQKFVHKYVNDDQVSTIVLLGNTFENQQYMTALKQWLPLRSEDIVCYHEGDLPSIVGVYAELDCTQFTSAEKHFEKQSVFEKEQQQRAEQKREAIKQAKVEDDKRRLQSEEKELNERQYKEAMEEAYAFEKKKDYANMRDYLDIALKKKPGDEAATQKLQEVDKIESEKKVKSEQYRICIEKADNSSDKANWEDALRQYELALTILPTAEYAEKKVIEVKQKLDEEQNIKELLVRADLFFAQKLYNNAITELKKASILNPNDKNIVGRMRQIEELVNAENEKIRLLRNELTTAESKCNYADAIKICEQLMEVDTSNLNKWNEKTSALRIGQKEYEQKQKAWSKCVCTIDEAAFDEDWERVVEACAEALKIREDANIQNKLARAKAKLDFRNKERQYTSLLEEVKRFMSSKQWKEAERQLNEMQRIYPEKKNDLKEFRIQIFEGEEANRSQKTPIASSPRNPIGFNVPKPDFFEKDTPPPLKRQTANKQPIAPPERKPKQTDEFDFDFTPKNKIRSESSETVRSLDIESKKTISDKDFNF